MFLQLFRGEVLCSLKQFSIQMKNLMTNHFDLLISQILFFNLKKSFVVKTIYI